LVFSRNILLKYKSYTKVETWFVKRSITAFYRSLILIILSTYLTYILRLISEVNYC